MCSAFTLITYAKIFQSEIIVCNATWNKRKLPRETVENERANEKYSGAKNGGKSDCKKSDVNATESFSIFVMPMVCSTCSRFVKCMRWIYCAD